MPDNTYLLHSLAQQFLVPSRRLLSGEPKHATVHANPRARVRLRSLRDNADALRGPDPVQVCATCQYHAIVGKCGLGLRAEPVEDCRKHRTHTRLRVAQARGLHMG